MTEESEKPATVTRDGDRYVLRLHGTILQSSRHQSATECLAADINTAIRRHAQGEAPNQRASARRAGE